MEPDQSQTPSNDEVQDSATESSPMYWPVGAVEEGKDGDTTEPYDSLFEITSVWD